jgi:hypothetical protein
MAAAVPVYVAIAQGIAASVAQKKQDAASKAAAKLQTDAANRAAELQTDATTHAADVGGQSNADMLAFLQQQETNRRADADRTQQLNFEQYQQDLARRQPFMNAGLGALAALGAPRPNQMVRPGATSAAPYNPSAGGSTVTQTPAPPGSLSDLLAQQKGA